MRILCVHQGYELYGSDRSFIQSVEALRRKWPDAHITACIPKRGPIAEPLGQVASEVVIEDLWVPRKNALLRLCTLDALRFPFSVMHAYSHMKHYDLVYINTMTILNYNIASRFHSMPRVIHVREIVNHRAASVFSSVLRFSRATIIYNSQATSQAYRLDNGQHSQIIHNGIRPVPSATPPSVDGPLKLLLLGRFNSWKGQDLLVDAVAQLSKKSRQKLHVRIVGGVFEDQQHFIEDVKAKIAENGLEDIIELLPFTDDPAELYAWADAVVVPSRKPEPFGRVAVEAMAHGRPVVAANHGGLSEIIEDGDTGWLFEPNEEAECAHILSHLVTHREEVRRAGLNALARFKARFSEQQYQHAVVSMFEQPMANEQKAMAA